MNRVLVASAGVAALSAGVAVGQPTLRLFSDFQPTGVSADGRVVVGTHTSPGDGYTDFDTPAIWSLSGGTVILPLPASALIGKPTGVSGDGRVVVGDFAYTNQPLSSWIWTAQTGQVPLTVPNTVRVDASCISRDGRVVGGIIVPTGQNFYQAFVWTQQEGARLIPGGSNYSTWLHALSADGLKGAGSGSSSGGTWGVFWGSTYGWCTSMGVVPGQLNGFAYAISGDGQTAVGRTMGPSGNDGKAFVWTHAGGLEVVDQPAGHFSTSFVAVSDDGNLAGGYAEGPSIIDAVLWQRGTGLVLARTFFASRGITFTPSTAVQRVTGISANGRIIVGTTATGGFLIDLGACGSADFDNDGSAATDADIQAFFACLGGDCCVACSADFDGDGDTATDADIAAFFRALGGAGC